MFHEFFEACGRLSRRAYIKYGWKEEDQEFEADLIEDLALNKSLEEIEARCSQYRYGSFQWALWLLEKGEGYLL